MRRQTWRGNREKGNEFEWGKHEYKLIVSTDYLTEKLAFETKSSSYIIQPFPLIVHYFKQKFLFIYFIFILINLFFNYFFIFILFI